MSLTETRTDLYGTLNTALTDPRVRVSKYPFRPGSLDRYDALVTIGMMAPSASEGTDMIEAELEVQIGVGDIETAFALMDEVLDDVDDALPIQWEAATWVVTVDQDDQVTLVAETTLMGHPSPEPTPSAGDNLLIGGTDSLLINATDALDIN